jgi:hypothetical protein
MQAGASLLALALAQEKLTCWRSLPGGCPISTQRQAVCEYRTWELSTLQASRSVRELARGAPDGYPTNDGQQLQPAGDD